MPIKGFVGLKSKMYNFITDDNHESEKEKWINKNVADDELKSEDYQNVLLNRSYRRHEINRIQSKSLNILSCRTNKNSLSSYEDKKHTCVYSKLLQFHIKNSFVKYRLFVLIFAIVKTAILF